MAAFRELRHRPGEEITVEFEFQDFELILRYISQTKWGPISQRSIRDFDDWLQAAPTAEKE